MVFQNAVSSLHPLFPVGRADRASPAGAHLGRLSPRGAAATVMLDSLPRHPRSENRARTHPQSIQRRDGSARRDRDGPHLRPSLLIADEPTTGLDATIQAQVLSRVYRRSRCGRERLGPAPDLPRFGVISAMCDIVAVVYAGELLELGYTREVLEAPLNPYTRGLVRAFLPRAARSSSSRVASRNRAPFTTSARSEDRCEMASERCSQAHGAVLRELRPDHWVACHNAR